MHGSLKYLQLIENAEILRGQFSFLQTSHQVGWVVLELLYQLFLCFSEVAIGSFLDNSVERLSIAEDRDTEF